jgi:hypothetical protein
MLERLDTLIAFATVLLGVSLLVTILNQMIASLLGHRATYLKDGIVDLLTTLDPKLVPYLKTIVNDVLTHKLASDSIFAHQSWAPQRWKLASTIRPEELPKLLTLVSQGKLYEQSITDILNQVNPTLAREAELMTKLAPSAAATTDQLIRELSNSTTKAIGRLEAGFNSTMDRVRQRFTLQMRIWTIVFSMLFAFVYHMDAKKIYAQLSADPVLRASLSNVSNDLMKTYSEVTATPSTGAGPGEQRPAAGNAPAGTNPTPEARSKELDERAKKLSEAYRDVRGKLSDFNLALFEVPQPWYRWESSEIFGILVMAGFLSLGAPFWYNTLKNLVNLRSQVAQKQQQDTAK